MFIINTNIFFLQSRYGRLTPLAKTLQEDPSCQLCSILQNYVFLSEIINIEANLKESDLPLLSTLRQVIIIKLRCAFIKYYLYRICIFINIINLIIFYIIGCHCIKQAMEERTLYAIIIGTQLQN